MGAVVADVVGGSGRDVVGRLCQATAMGGTEREEAVRVDGPLETCSKLGCEALLWKNCVLLHCHKVVWAEMSHISGHV